MLQNSKTQPLISFSDSYQKKVVSTVESREYDNIILKNMRKKRKLTLENFIKKACIPVCLSKLILENTDIVVPSYKALIQKESKQILTVVGKKFQLFENAFIIESVLHYFHTENIPFHLGGISFCTKNSMVAHFILDMSLSINDKKQYVSIIISNEYTLESSFKIFIGLTDTHSNILYIFPSSYYFMKTHHNRKIYPDFIHFIDNSLKTWNKRYEKLQNILSELSTLHINKESLFKFKYFIRGSLLTFILKDAKLIPSTATVQSMSEYFKYIPEYIPLSQFSVLQSSNYYLCNVIKPEYRLTFLYRVSKIFNL